MTSVAVPAAGVELVKRGRVQLAADAPAIFVVPAYNEEENLPNLLGDLERGLAAVTSPSRVLVVDDGSEDATSAVVQRYEGPLTVDLVRLDRNSGPGAAFRAGFVKALAQCPADALIVTLEADATSDLGALPEMLARARGGADLVLASWVMENVSWKRRLLSRAAGWVVRICLGLNAQTVSSFFRVYRADALREAFDHYGDGLIREQGFACKAELLAKIAGLGARIDEVPVGLDTSRRVGKSKMPIMRTIGAYWRMMARHVFARGPAAT